MMNLKEAKEKKKYISDIIASKFVVAHNSSHDIFPGIGLKPNYDKNELEVVIHVIDENQRHYIKESLGKEDIDIEITGLAYAYADSTNRCSQHSLSMGASISRSEATSQPGTLGCFVQRQNDPSLMILSNAHILCDITRNRGNIGDDILLPAWRDGGNPENHLIATLAGFDKRLMDAIHGNDHKFDKAIHGNDHKFDKAIRNLPIVDAGIARLCDNQTNREEINKIHNNRYLQGIRDQNYLIQVLGQLERANYPVFKFGKATGFTQGYIYTIQQDEPVHYGLNLNLNNEAQTCSYRFSDMIFIKGEEDEPFSRSGDSGSLIYDSEGYAIALLLGGVERSGKNGDEPPLTFALPIDRVFAILNIRLPSL
jgi:hypothetical protein